MRRFAVIGLGYVAKKYHLPAIKAIGGELVAVCDPHDEVGILDSYNPRCEYYRDQYAFFLRV
ncbi:MAG: oxidoreductase, partial [Planctomycetota bacterium]